MASDLRNFFEPKSVAVVGASATPGKAGNAVMSNLVAGEYGGRIYPVNQTSSEVLGFKAYRSVKDLPEIPDVAIIIVPASVTVETLRECAAKGIKAAAIVSAGFTEVDERGAALQDAIVEIAHKSGLRVIGPNTSGLISTPVNFNAAFYPLGKIPRGTVAYVAQTGNFGGATMSWILSAENFGVSRVISLGNKCDVDDADALEFLGNDPETRVICIYLEGFKDGRRFIEAARRASKKKPIIALKGGMTSAGVRAAVSHTASLGMNNPGMIDGIFRQAGVARVRRYTELLDTAKALAFQPLPSGPRVGIVVPSGALGVLAADACYELGLKPAVLSEDTVQKLREISPAWIRVGNPIDIWPAVQLQGVEGAYTISMEAALSDSGVDALISVLLLTREAPASSLDFVPRVAEKHPGKPLLVCLSGEKLSCDAARTFLERRSIPTYPPVEGACEALATMYQCYRYMSR